MYVLCACVKVPVHHKEHTTDQMCNVTFMYIYEFQHLYSFIYIV